VERAARAAASALPTSTSTVTPPTTTTTTGESKRLLGSTGSSHASSHNVSSDASLSPGSSNSKNGSSGSATTANSNNSTASPQQPQQQQQQQQQQQHLPFVPSSSTSKQAHPQQQQQQQQHHRPPEGFVIAARVYTDPKDKLSHFDMDPAALTLPYWDCGVAGSTTPYISLKHAYFRHALAATTTVISSNDSYSYSTSSHSSNSNPDSMHPVLVVALTPVTIEVNSGDAVQHFQPGDVILLEDVLRPGHKMRPSRSNQKHQHPHHHLADVQLLFLSMPHPYHHVGKDHVSMEALASNSRAMQSNPCPATNTVLHEASGDRDSDGSGSSSTTATVQSDTSSQFDSSGASGSTTTGYVQESSSSSSTLSESSSRPYLVYQPPPSPFTQWWKHRDAGRWVVLGVAGLSVSTLMADFLGKTAPLWLAVGVGGGCFVAASTYTFCRAGNALWTALEMWYEQHRLGEPLQASSSSSSNTMEDEDEEQYDDDGTGSRLHQQKTTEEASGSTTAFDAM
jgi:hypothetical protein